MAQPQTVFVVEDYTYVTDDDQGHGARPRLWSQVYLSLPRAKRGVEHWASRAGHEIRWTDLNHGVAAEDGQGRGLFKVLPFGVLGDDDPEPH